MSTRVASAPSAQIWFDSLAEWRWPGEAAPVVPDTLPPEWIPALPPAAQPAADAVARPAGNRTVLPAVLLASVAALAVALALHGGVKVQRAGRAASARVASATYPPSLVLQASPKLTLVSRASSGSEIAHVSFPSVSVHGRGGFLAYLPPHFSRSARYPVLYLLHGNEQLAVEFLRQGDLQSELDRLIAAGEVPPMIAIMPEGGRGAIEWRNLGGERWESYILEVQELADRVLPTIPQRDARAVAGDSMGAYGAMSVTLNNIYRFGIAESWLGFFNGLEGQLRLDRSAIRRLGLTAFVYGGTEDHIADPAEDAPWAAALRAAGAQAHSAIYPGEHNMQTVQAHMASQLRLVGAAFRRAEGDRPPGVRSAR